MTPLEDAYRILELKPGTPKEDVKRQYKLLINVWHPDKQTRDDVRRFAEEKLKAITNAFAAVEAAGFPGAAPFAPERPQPHPPTPRPQPPRTETRSRPAAGPPPPAEQATGPSVAAICALIGLALFVLGVVNGWPGLGGVGFFVGLPATAIWLRGAPWRGAS